MRISNENVSKHFKENNTPLYIKEVTCWTGIDEITGWWETCEYDECEFVLTKELYKKGKMNNWVNDFRTTNPITFSITKEEYEIEPIEPPKEKKKTSLLRLVWYFCIVWGTIVLISDVLRH